MEPRCDGNRPVDREDGKGRLPPRVWFVGHATVVIDLDGTRILTDPLLRGRVAALMRRHPLPRSILARPADAVWISHMHQDHLDVPSLRQLGRDTRLYVPRRAGSFLRRRGFRATVELRPGDAAAAGAVRLVATPANHSGFRPPFGPYGESVGFIVEGSVRIYFAGDTDLFPEMGALGPVDVALLPVAGWGPSLGPGHMDPLRAARALRLIRPKVAVPIHWGTLAPVGMHFRTWSYLTGPPLEFLAYARALAPDVDVRVLEPGAWVALESPIPRPVPVGDRDDRPPAPAVSTGAP